VEPPGQSIRFGSRQHFPDNLTIGLAESHFALDPEALYEERGRLTARAVSMPRIAPWTGPVLQGSIPCTNPSRREAASVISLWPLPGRVDRHATPFPIRLSDPERYQVGPAFVLGPEGAAVPALDNRELILLMFEGSSEMRPPGGVHANLSRLRLDERDIMAGARLQDAARIFCHFRDAFDLNGGDGNESWFIPLRAMLARMVVGLTFEFNVLQICNFAGAWGHISWLPDNDGYRRREHADREALYRVRHSYVWDPFTSRPGAFDLPGVDAQAAAAAGNRPAAAAGDRLATALARADAEADRLIAARAGRR
jgi:hypothetical protein